jgi:hypothetical protein
MVLQQVERPLLPFRQALFQLARVAPAPKDEREGRWRGTRAGVEQKDTELAVEND